MSWVNQDVTFSMCLDNVSMAGGEALLIIEKESKRTFNWIDRFIIVVMLSKHMGKNTAILQ